MLPRAVEQLFEETDLTTPQVTCDDKETPYPVGDSLLKKINEVSLRIHQILISQLSVLADILIGKLEFELFAYLTPESLKIILSGLVKVSSSQLPGPVPGKGPVSAKFFFLNMASCYGLYSSLHIYMFVQ